MRIVTERENANYINSFNSLRVFEQKECVDKSIKVVHYFTIAVDINLNDMMMMMTIIMMKIMMMMIITVDQ